MKTINKFLLCVAVSVFGLTACVQNLDVTPHDENKIMDFNQDAVFSKCYSTLALTGQAGPAGSPDVDDIDEGSSSFFRMIWLLQEMPSDEYWIPWNDPGFPDLRTTKWNSLNQQIQGLYYRLYIDINPSRHPLR